MSSHFQSQARSNVRAHNGFGESLRPRPMGFGCRAPMGMTVRGGPMAVTAHRRFYPLRGLNASMNVLPPPVIFPSDVTVDAGGAEGT